MYQFYGRIHNQNPNNKSNEQFARIYKSLIKLEYPREKLPDATYVPRQVWPILEFLMGQVTGKQVDKLRVSSTLREIKYPYYQRLENRQLDSDNLTPELLDVVVYLLSIVDVNVHQHDYTDEFPKLAAMREDFILEEYSALGNEPQLMVIRQSYEEKCQKYLDNVQQAIDDTLEDVTLLESAYRKKSAEPAAREKIRDVAAIVELDWHQLEEYSIKAQSKFEELLTTLEECKQNLEQSHDQLIDLEQQRLKYEKILDNSGFSLAELLSESNRVKLLREDLANAKETISEMLSLQEQNNTRFAQASLPIQRKLLYFNHTFGVDLPTELNYLKLPDIDSFTNLQNKIHLEARNLSLETVKLKTAATALTHELDSYRRKELLQMDTKERLETEVSLKQKDIERLMENPGAKEYELFTRREQSKKAQQQRYDELVDLENTLKEELKQLELQSKLLDDQVDTTLKPLYERIETKRDQLKRVYDTLQLGVTSLQTYTKEYMDVCEELQSDAAEIKEPKVKELRVNAVALLDLNRSIREDI